MSDITPEKTDDTALLRSLQQKSFETTDVKNPTTLQEYINLAKQLAASGLFPDAKTAQQAVGLMILGSHFGIGPVQSLSGIHVVKGKPMLHYMVLLSKIREHPHYDYKIMEKTATTCTIRIFNKLTAEHDDVTFTAEMARKAGTQNMDKFPETMLLARATGIAVRSICPDVVMGMPIYAQGELPEPSSHEDVPQAERVKADLEAKLGEPAKDAEFKDEDDQ